MGTDDVQFQLRSERQGGGDGRKYTIVYTATDCSGNSTTEAVCVTVPHDQGGGALAVSGFNANGTGFEAGSTEFTIVIRHLQAGEIDVSRIFVGNLHGFYEPTYRRWADVTGDHTADLVVRFETQPAIAIAMGIDDPSVSGNAVTERKGKGKDRAPDPLALRYLTKSGVGYLVNDIYKLPILDSEIDGGEDRDELDITSYSKPGLSMSPDGVKLTLAQGGFVQVDVFSVQGRKVRTLVSRPMSAGTHLLAWNGSDEAGNGVANGVYFYRLNAPGLTQVQRVVRIR